MSPITPPINRVNMQTVKRHEGWKATTVAERCIEESIARMQTANYLYVEVFKLVSILRMGENASTISEFMQRVLKTT